MSLFEMSAVRVEKGLLAHLMFNCRPNVFVEPKNVVPAGNTLGGILIGAPGVGSGD